MKPIYYNDMDFVNVEFPLPTLELAELGYQPTKYTISNRYLTPAILLHLSQTKDPEYFVIFEEHGELIPLNEWIDTQKKLNFLEAL